MSNNSTDSLQGTIDRSEDAIISHVYNSFLLNILLLGMLFLNSTFFAHFEPFSKASIRQFTSKPCTYTVSMPVVLRYNK